MRGRKSHGESKHSSSGSETSCSSRNNNSSSQQPQQQQQQRRSRAGRVRTVLTEKQLQLLKSCYVANPRPDALMKEQLVEMTGLSPRYVAQFNKSFSHLIGCKIRIKRFNKLYKIEPRFYLNSPQKDI